MGLYGIYLLLINSSQLLNKHKMGKKFTPGPWLKLNHTTVWIGDQAMEANNGYVIASCTGSDHKANTQLIAAAPDLLEALQDLMNHYEINGQLLSWDVSIARNAILKP